MTEGLLAVLLDTVGARQHAMHTWADSRYLDTSWDQVVAEAERMTEGLQRVGVGPGAVVASVLANGPMTLPATLAVWMRGATLASLPLPSRGMSMDAYLRQIQSMLLDLAPTLLALDKTLLSIVTGLGQGLATPLRSWESFRDTGAAPIEDQSSDDVCFVQYSSGSTSDPKGCALSVRAVTAQLRMIQEMIGLEWHRETCVTWLPMSHDMGLFGTALSALAVDADLWMSPPERFAMAPQTWMRDAAEVGATITVGTSTALSLAARRATAPLPARLRLHTLILGAERVTVESLTAGLNAFGPSGLTAETYMPAYGMAENVLAATATPRHQAPTVITADSAGLAVGELALVDPDTQSATRIVSSGVPCRGVQIHAPAPGVIDELVLSSPSLATGYVNHPEATAARFTSGRLLTRDLGFIQDGLVYPMGRTDDVLSVGGRKVHAREIEAALEALSGARTGCLALLESTEPGFLDLMVELTGDAASSDRFAREAADILMERAAVGLGRCVVVKRGMLPKTPSGKIQRHRCVGLTDGASSVLAVVDLGTR